MKLHYMGKYDLNPESIPTKPHRPNHVAFKEPKDSKSLSKLVTLISILLIVIFLIPVYLRSAGDALESTTIGGVLTLLAMFPHEILHALCFKEDVYLYTNLRHGLLFVAGPEDMSKSRFIFMSLLPSIIFGIIPYLVFLIKPDFLLLGAFGACNLACGAGDYLNIFNAITQMPAGSRTYLYHFNSYWYMPEE